MCRMSKKNREDSQFCIYCGRELYKTCTECESSQLVIANYCGACGAQFDRIDANKNRHFPPMTIKEAEECLIKQALKKTKGIQTRAAVLLGISERALRYKLKNKPFMSKK